MSLMESMMSVEIDTSSFVKMRHELDLFAHDLKEELDKRLRVVTQSIVSDAKSQVQAHGGSGAGYKVKRKARGDDLVLSAIGTTAGSAILEFAAVGRCNQGRSLVKTLDTRYGAPGRVLWDAYDRQDPPAQVQRIVSDISREFEARVRRF